MGEEERPAVGRPERQPRCRNSSRAVREVRAARPAAMVDLRVDRMRRRGRREHIGDQAFVPAADRMVHRPFVRRAPVPVEHVGALRVPVPLDRRATARRSARGARALLPRRRPKYCRAASRPAIRNAVSTRSPPSSFGLKRMALPVRAVQPVREGAVKAVALARGSATDVRAGARARLRARSSRARRRRGSP